MCFTSSTANHHDPLKPGLYSVCSFLFNLIQFYMNVGVIFYYTFHPEAASYPEKQTYGSRSALLPWGMRRK